MKLKVTKGKIAVRPPVVKPHPGFFYEVGEERFRKLVFDHYESIKSSEISLELQERIKEKPLQSLVVAFGVGLFFSKFFGGNK